MCFVYPQVDLDGLGAGGSCGSTWNILSDNSEAVITLFIATVVLSKGQTQDAITGHKH